MRTALIVIGVSLMAVVTGLLRYVYQPIGSNSLAGVNFPHSRTGSHNIATAGPQQSTTTVERVSGCNTPSMGRRYTSQSDDHVFETNDWSMYSPVAGETPRFSFVYPDSWTSDEATGAFVDTSGERVAALEPGLVNMPKQETCRDYVLALESDSEDTSQFISGTSKTINGQPASISTSLVDLEKSDAGGLGNQLYVTTYCVEVARQALLLGFYTENEPTACDDVVFDTVISSLQVGSPQ